MFLFLRNLHEGTKVQLRYVHFEAPFLLPRVADILTCYWWNICLDSSSQTSIVSIPEYNLERIDRNRHGSGVAIYIRDTITYMSLEAPNRFPRWSFGIYCIDQVSKPKVKPVVVCTCLGIALLDQLWRS